MTTDPHALLSAIVGRELGKLDRLSQLTPDAPLDGDQLEGLESLAKCLKTLVGPAGKADGGDEPAASTEELLQAAK